MKIGNWAIRAEKSPGLTEKGTEGGQRHSPDSTNAALAGSFVSRLLLPSAPARFVRTLK
jgi:hypothetical protein